MAKLIERPDCILNRTYRHQVLAAFIVNIIALSHGIGVGWLSPTLRRLQSDDSPLSFSVDTEQASWIGSLLGLGSLTGNLVFGFLIDRIGRKKCIYAVAIPTIATWVMIYYAKNVNYLYVARFVCGCTGGSTYVIMPIYISEIADKTIRGSLGTIMILTVNFGVLIGFVMSTHLPYHTVPLIVLPLTLLYLVGTVALPETPHHLIRKGQLDKALASFGYYKNCPVVSAECPKRNCAVEFQQLREALTTGKTAEKLTYHDVFNWQVIQIYITAFVLVFVNQFCGLFAFVNYMSHIFAASGSSLDADTSTIAMGVVQICGVYAATVFVDKCGRKTLMLLSVGGVAAGVLLMGFFTEFVGNSPDYGWVPLVLMTVVLFVGNMGLVALTFVVLVELFPTKIRALGASTCMAMLSVFVFALLKVFPVFMEHYGISVTMWACGTITTVGFVYLWLFLPETKGKSMEE